MPLHDPSPPGPVPTTIIPAGSTWKYLDDGSNQGTAWRNPGFNDSPWPTGRAQFGYGDGDEATAIRSNRLDNSRIQTTYFRKTFVLSNAWTLTNLYLGLLRDDGGIVYLNGVEVFRSNMTNAPTLYYTNWAVTAFGGADETTFFTTNVSPALLHEGTNLISVEVHQASVTSTDVSFDFWLAALAYQFPGITISATNSQLHLLWPQAPAGFLLQSSPALGSTANWTSVTNAASTTTNGFHKAIVSPSTSATFYRLRRP